MSHPVASIRFDRRKYGSHLLADACTVASLPGFIKTPHPHRLAFYEVALITEGRGSLALDGVEVEVAPWRVCVTAPGEIRSWRLDDSRLGGLLAFFDTELFDDASADRDFVARLPIVAAPARERSFAVEKRCFDSLAEIVATMSSDLRAPDRHTTDLLRAQTCALLIGVQRASSAHARPPGTRAAIVARRFAHLVGERFRLNEPVSRYADAIGVSARHLNQCVRACTGRTASEAIQARLHLEARRLLQESQLSVTAIAETLGFSDTPYFIRFFKRHAAMTPGEFRAAQQSPIADRICPLPRIDA